MFQLNLKQTGVLSNSDLLTLRSMAKHNTEHNIAIKKCSWLREPGRTNSYWSEGVVGLACTWPCINLIEGVDVLMLEFNGKQKILEYKNCKHYLEWNGCILIINSSWEAFFFKAPAYRLFLIFALHPLVVLDNTEPPTRLHSHPHYTVPVEKTESLAFEYIKKKN